MATFEIETIEYRNNGNIKKEFELFGSKKDAINHMRKKIKDRQYYQLVGKV